MINFNKLQKEGFEVRKGKDFDYIQLKNGEKFGIWISSKGRFAVKERNIQRIEINERKERLSRIFLEREDTLDFSTVTRVKEITVTITSNEQEKQLEVVI